LNFVPYFTHFKETTATMKLMEREMVVGIFPTTDLIISVSLPEDLNWI